MPYKEKPYTKKITIDGRSYWIRAKSPEELEAKAIRRRVEIEYGLQEKKTKKSNLTVDSYAVDVWLPSKATCGAKERKSLKSTLYTWVIPDPGLGAADKTAYDKEKHIRTSAAVDENGKQKRRRKLDTKLEAERCARLSKTSPRPTLRGKRLNEVVLSDLEAIVIGMAVGGYSVSSLQKVTRIMKQIFRKAKADRLIQDDPSVMLKVPAAVLRFDKTDGHRSVTDEERALFLRTAETHRGGLFIYTMLYAGLRSNEVAALRWKDIDLKERVLHVRCAIKDGEGIGPPKSKAGIRDIPISDPFAEILSGVTNKRGLLCTNSRGGQYTSSSIQSMWQSFKRQMNIDAGCKTFKGRVVEPLVAEDLTLYCLRHTFCTDLAAAGVPLDTARRLMGHESILVTSRIYTHFSQDVFDAAADKINAYHEKKAAKK